MLLKQKREQLNIDFHESDVRPHLLSEVSVTVVTSDDDLQDLSELTHSEAPSSSGVNELCFMNDMSLNNALFSEFLRSSSSSLCHISEGHDKDALQISISPQTIVPANICLFSEKDPHLTDLAAERISEIKHNNIQTKRPCVTLRVRPTITASKPKVSLRLNPPKRAQKPNPKNRSSKRV